MKKYSKFMGFVLVMLIACSLFSVAASASQSETPDIISEQTEVSYSCTVHLLLEAQSYSVGESIPIIIAVDADSAIDSFTCTYEGFEANETFDIKNSLIVGILRCYAETQAQFHITITLENGMQSEATLLGSVVDNVVWMDKSSISEKQQIHLITNDSMNDIIMERNDNSVSIMATTYNITISGTLQWQDDWGNSHPLQYTKVTVMDEGGGLLGLWDKELGTTYTNALGYYAFNFQNKGACNPYLKVHPEGANTVVKKGNGNDYVWETDTLENITTSRICDRTISMSHAAGPAFQISQAVISASNFVSLAYGRNFEAVTVKYPHQEGYANTYYKDKTIFVEDTEYDAVTINGNVLNSYASWDVIQHEFFHHVQEQLEITESPGDWHAVGINMYTHYISHHGSSSSKDCLDEEDNITCANPNPDKAKEAAVKLIYAEAVASILGGIAQDYLVNGGLLDSNIKTVGDACYTAYNGAVFDYENAHPGHFMGEINEIAVAAILWDIYDDVPEVYDTISLGYADFWNALLSNSSTTLSAFITAFYTTYPQYKWEISGNLQNYKIVATPLTPNNISFYSLPSFSWIANGSESPSYQNNVFDLVVYNQYNVELLRKTVNTTSCTLTEAEWNTILLDTSDTFYFSIATSQFDGYCSTGPYYSTIISFSKPPCMSLTTSDSRMEYIEDVGDYHWYKFVSTTSGTYTFYTTGSMDTYGDLFAKPFYGLGITDRLAYNDDVRDEEYNFSITYELDYGQAVYIRVRAYDDEIGHYTIFATFNQHIHHYNAEYLYVNTSTHQCICDCGLYEIEEHDWRSVGSNRMYCVDCHRTLTGTVPGGSISSIGDDEVVDTMICVAMPTETNAKDEE